jgi:hypothetical protein
MSKKKVGKKIIVDIIRNVLESREDVVLDDAFIFEVTTNTLKSTPVYEIISDMAEVDLVPEDRKEHFKLSSCIELIAIINNVIDHQISVRNFN